MTISVSCSCGKSFRVKPELAGKRAKCPSCGGPLDIPNPNAAQSPTDDWMNMDLGKAGLSNSPSLGNVTAKVTSAYGAPLTKTSGSTKSSGVHPAVWGAVGGGVLLLVIIAGVGVWAVASSAKSTDPAPTTIAEKPSTIAAPISSDASGVATTFKEAKPVWAASLDAPKAAIEWPTAMESKIPTPPPTAQIIYPATPSPYAVYGLTVVGGDAKLLNLTTAKDVGAIKEKIEFGSLCTLSPDGQLFAIRQGKPGAPSGEVNLFSFKTGAGVKRFSCDEPQMLIQEIVFSRPDRLVTLTSGMRGAGRLVSIRVWSMPDAKLLHEFQPQFGFSRKQFAISPGGRYMVASEGNRLYSLDLDAGTIVGNQSIQEASPKSEGIVTGISFSPDGRQFGVVQSKTNTVLELFDATNGKLVDAIELAGKPPLASGYRGEPIEWLGDKGWSLFGSTIIERKSRRVVWNLQPLPVDLLTERITLPTGWIVHSGPFNQKSLQFVPIPWKAIDASLAAIDSASDALLRPGQSVSLQLNIGNLQHGNVEDTKARLEKLFSERLLADKIEVKDDQPVSLKIEYSESKGEMLTERESISGPATGRKFQSTDVDMIMTLGMSDGSKVFWTDKDKYAPRLVTVTQAEVNEAVIRDSVFRQLLFSLSAKPIPFFIPNDSDQAVLPGTTAIAE
jgi:hypothetical protein